MKRVCLSATLACATIVAACSSSHENSGAPTSPTPPGSSSPTVSAVTVTAAPASSTTFQMAAKAAMSDGSSRDVTAQSQWTTSSADIATISASGLLTVVHSGQVEVRATYQSATGSMGMTVNAPQPPPSGGATFIVSGLVHETAPDAKPLAGAVVRIVGGPDAGASTTTSADGRFGFVKITGGDIGLQAEKAGYIVWQLNGLQLDRDRELEVVLFPTPPKNDSGVSATARCMDKSWSWAQTRADACTANGGVAYVVCPGPMCDMQTSR
jgi:hypothetical protein